MGGGHGEKLACPTPAGVLSVHACTAAQRVAGQHVFCLVAVEAVIVQFGSLTERQLAVPQQLGLCKSCVQVSPVTLPGLLTLQMHFPCRAGRHHPPLHLCPPQRAQSLQERRPPQRQPRTLRQQMPVQDWAPPRIRWAQAKPELCANFCLKLLLSTCSSGLLQQRCMLSSL